MAPRAALPLLALGALACARSDEEWIGDLQDPSAGSFERGMAAIALAEQAPAKANGAVFPLLVLLDGPESPLRAHAAGAMRQIAPWKVDELVRTLVGATFLTDDCRISLEEAIVSSGAIAVPPLLAAMRAPGERSSREIGALLARIGEPAVDPLLELALAEPESSAGVDAIWVLGRCGSAADRILPPLVEALRSPQVGASLAAADSLWRIDPEGGRVLPPLREMLSDDQRIITVAAARAITHILVMRASAAADAERVEMLGEIARFGEPILPSLVEELAITDPAGAGRRRAAWDCLVAIGGRWTVLAPAARRLARPLPRLLSLLGNPEETERVGAAIELARRGRDSAPAIPSLVQACGDGHESVRKCAALALCWIAVDLGWVGFR